jgi:hypothetical protein
MVTASASTTTIDWLGYSDFSTQDAFANMLEGRSVRLTIEDDLLTGGLLSDAETSLEVLEGSSDSISTSESSGLGELRVDGTNSGLQLTTFNFTFNGVAAYTQATSDWFSQSFYDQDIADMTRSFYSDGFLSRTEVISLFRSAQDSGVVDGYEFADLRTLVSYGSALGMAEYVQVLSEKIAYGSVSNTFFQGYSLGDLYAGSSSLHLEALISEHFYGQDRPSQFISATNSSSARSISYGYISGELFGYDNSFSVTDIQQGALGDCYFLASLGALAWQAPSAIENMFLDNGDGTFTVRFFGAQNGNVTEVDYVTVDRFLPIDVSTANSTGGKFAAYDSMDVGLWVALAEKAYAQFAEAGLSQRPVDPATGLVANSYGSIEGGWGFQTMPSITGTAAYVFSDNPNYGSVGNLAGSMLSLQDIDWLLTNGYALTAGTIGSSDTTLDPRTGIVHNHEYTILDTDLSTGMMALYNPWGDTDLTGTGTGDVNGIKTISYSDFLTVFNEIGVA